VLVIAARVSVDDELRPPPIIYQGSQNQTLPVDSTALLPCLASGEPAPVIFWLKDSTPLTGSEHRLHVLDSGALQISRQYIFRRPIAYLLIDRITYWSRMSAGPFVYPVGPTFF